MGAIITLTTDFGTQDPYVAMMKAVILGINPQAVVVDICHQVQPQNVAQAAFILGISHPYFPSGTIHIAVVDPGVGTARRGVALATPDALFVGPDNGIFSYILEELAPPWGPPAAAEPGVLALRGLGPGLRAVSLDDARFFCHPVSHTFHGRDIFAPVAAHLSLGIPLKALGQELPALYALPAARPRRVGDILLGQVLHVDAFGNLITNFRESDLPLGRLGIEVAGQRIQGLSISYAEGEELLALIGSSGYLEIAATGGSAAATLGVGVGTNIDVKRRV